eukprot:COSAG02_NODE_19613_length_873_cov_1.322997_1_plen_195_part_10
MPNDRPSKPDRVCTSGIPFVDCRPCNGSSYSTAGSACVNCTRPMVLDINRTTCTVCRAGRGPDASFRICEDCVPGKISTYGEPCKKCETGTTANQERTSCVQPFHCPAGFECKHGLGKCPDETLCIRCSAGHVSTAESQCTQCVKGTGVRANQNRTFCERCTSGTEPSEDLDNCVACSGTNYSRTGLRCEVCPAP